MSALLEVDALCAVRDGRAVLGPLSFEAAAGEMIGVIGPNGAGKSTLLRALAGVDRPASGAVRIDGAEISQTEATLRARTIAYLPQSRPVYWPISARRIVALGRFAFGAPDRLGSADAAAVERAIAAAGIAAFADRPADALSGGEAARVHLARALAAEAPILLADEPTAALDPRHQLAIMNALGARAAAGALVMLALHDLALAARFCSRVLVIVEGKLIADGPPATAMAREVLGAAFGVDAEIVGAGEDVSVRLRTAR